jgi:FkbM family methyltransferase
MQYSKFNNVYFDFINAKLRQGMKLRIDVGTSINAPVSKWWADNLEDRFIIVIEPNPDCWHAQNLHPRLQQFMNVPKVFGDNDNVYGIEGGCDNVTELEQKDFHIMNYHQGNSSFLMPHNGVIPNDEQDITIDRTEKVDVFSLGMLLDKLDYEYVELIKTDAQGKDLDIMKGLGDHVDRVLHMDCENDVTNQYAGAGTYGDLLSYAEEIGFEKYANLPGGDTRFWNTRFDGVPNGYTDKTGDASY